MADVSMKQIAANAKELKKKLAEQSGVPEEAVNDNTLKEVSSALDGAKVASEKGQDPTKVPIQELKAAGGGEVKDESPEELSNQQKLAMALTVIAPSLIGYAVGGKSGGAIGAQAGGKAVEAYGSSLDKEQERKRVLAKEGADRQLKERELARTETKDKEEGARKDKELSLKEQEIISNRRIKEIEKELSTGKDKKDIEMKLSHQYQTDQLVKDQKDMAIAVQKIRDGSAPGLNQYDDMGLVFNYMKLLDPGSVVREGEYATAAKYASLLERMGIQWDKVKTGRPISAEQRKAIAEAGERQFGAQKSKFDEYTKNYGDMAERLGASRENVILSFGSDSGKKAPQEQPPGGIAKGGSALNNNANAAPAPAGRKKALEQMSEQELEEHIANLKKNSAGE